MHLTVPPGQRSQDDRLPRIFGKSPIGRLRSWELGRRRARYLRRLDGAGIEIGALQRPTVAPHLKVRYVDRITREQALEEFPELDPRTIVEIDIVDDAADLTTLPDDSQDFVIASHVIEHMPDPIGALRTWARVMRPGGRMFLAVPDKHESFDRERQITPLAHLIQDAEDPSPERDYQAFEEFALLVGCRYFKHRPETEYREYARELFESRYSIHYHVWDYPSFDELLRYLRSEGGTSLEVVDSMPTFAAEFIFILEKR